MRSPMRDPPDAFPGRPPDFATLIELRDAMPLRDAEGRPLGEHHLSASHLDGVKIERGSCSHAGSRHGHRVNLSAQRQVDRHWPRALALLSRLERSYRRHPSPPATSRLLRLYRLSRSGSLLPCYLQLRSVDPVADGELPAFVSVTFKALLGLVRTFSALLIDEVTAGAARGGEGEPAAAPPAGRSLEVPALLERIEEQGLFLTPGGACPASIEQVTEALSVVVYGDGPRWSDEPLARLLPDPEVVFAFGERAIDVGVLYLSFLVRKRRVLLRLRDALEGLREDARGLRWRLLGLDRPPHFAEESFAWNLAGREEAYRRRVLEGIRSWATPAFRAPLAVFQEGEISAFDMDRPGEDVLVSVVDDLRERAEPGAERVLSALRPHLLHYLRLEVEMLRALAPCEADLYRLLGYGAPERTVSGDDISRRYGSATLRDEAAAILGVDIQVGPAGLRVSGPA